MKYKTKHGVFLKILLVIFIAGLLVSLGIMAYFLFVSAPYLYNMPKEMGMKIYLCIAAIFVEIVLIILIDVLMKNEKQETLEHTAFYDDLTDIYNKTRFLSATVDLVKQDKSNYSVVSLDVNNFRGVNELFGFDGGDMLLQFIAKTILSSIGKNELCCRDANDVFYMLLHSKSEITITQRIRAIQEQIGQFATKRGAWYHIITTAGVYCIQPDDEDVKTCCDRANRARNSIKGNHNSQIAFYSKTLYQKESRKNEIENDMRVALEREEFKIYLQPQFYIKDNTLRGAEALVRWDHPINGRIPPDEFIPLFEENGFIIELDSYIVAHCCRLLRKWEEMHLKPTVISINQSRRHLYQPNYITSMRDLIRTNRGNTQQIELELTESFALENPQQLKNLMQGLHEQGFSVSMDDFGSGYSSLNALKDFDIDVIKIDKEFFSEATVSEKGRSIIKNVIAMAKDLSLEVIAEGVENEEEVNFLRDCNCDTIQGYFKGKPMTPEEFQVKFLDVQ